MPYPYGKTITVTPQITSSFGDRTAGVAVEVDGCVVYQTPGVETVGGQDTVVYDVTILAPPGTSISSTDVVCIDGAQYEISSQPIVWQSPFTGTEPGVQFTVRRVVG